ALTPTKLVYVGDQQRRHDEKMIDVIDVDTVVVRLPRGTYGDDTSEL
ncbi:647_t:CDS:1, partial [Ambispora leptoticha]